MEPSERDDRLSKISTAWEMLHSAHTGSPSEAAAAQGILLGRYGGAVRRYLARALGDPTAVDDLTQEFALSLVRGDFRHADPHRGRFRDYVKAVLFHLVSKYRRGKQRQPVPVAEDNPELAALTSPVVDPDREFVESWREAMLSRAWEALAGTQPEMFSVLHLRATHPKLPSGQMAEQLSRQLGKPLTAAGVRQTLRRARARFVDLLVEEVAHSLGSSSPQRVEQELRDLNLFVYCQPVLNPGREDSESE
jgi:RNA polymerase sigma factor (sigma-70 family)